MYQKISQRICWWRGFPQNINNEEPEFQNGGFYEDAINLSSNLCTVAEREMEFSAVSVIGNDLGQQ